MINIAIEHKKIDNGSKKSGTKPRIYIWVKGETLLENLHNRHSRPVKFYKTQVLPKLFEELNVNPKTVNARWSQKAGCSCGCSPGFIVDGYIPDCHNQDIHVDVAETSEIKFSM